VTPIFVPIYHLCDPVNVLRLLHRNLTNYLGTQPTVLACKKSLHEKTLLRLAGSSHNQELHNSLSKTSSCDPSPPAPLQWFGLCNLLQQFDAEPDNSAARQFLYHVTPFLVHWLYPKPAL
jgi:hypothetical protein